MLKNILKINKIQEYYQCKKTPKGTQSLNAGVVSCGRPDFAGPVGVTRKSFTTSGFIDMLFSLLNHLGYLLTHRAFFLKHTIAGNPDCPKTRIAVGITSGAGQFEASEGVMPMVK